MILFFTFSQAKATDLPYQVDDPIISEIAEFLLQEIRKKDKNHTSLLLGYEPKSIIAGTVFTSSGAVIFLSTSTQTDYSIFLIRNSSGSPIFNVREDNIIQVTPKASNNDVFDVLGTTTSVGIIRLLESNQGGGQIILRNAGGRNMVNIRGDADSSGGIYAIDAVGRMRIISSSANPTNDALAIDHSITTTAASIIRLIETATGAGQLIMNSSNSATRVNLRADLGSTSDSFIIPRLSIGSDTLPTANLHIYGNQIIKSLSQVTDPFNIIGSTTSISIVRLFEGSSGAGGFILRDAGGVNKVVIRADATASSFDAAEVTFSQGLTATGDMTAGRVFYSSGNINLGDASGDLITAKAASFTFVNTSTISMPAGSLLSYAEPTACGKISSDSDGSFELLRDSSPASIHTAWETVNSATLNSTNAKAAWLLVQCFHTNDATSGGALTNLLLGQGGTSAGTLVCRAGVVASNEEAYDNNTTIVALNSNKDFDFSCRPVTAVDTNTECEIRLAGWCE